MKSLALAIMFIGMGAISAYLEVNDKPYSENGAQIAGFLQLTTLGLFYFSLFLS